MKTSLRAVADSAPFPGCADRMITLECAKEWVLMSSRDRRLKASDVFARTDFFLGKTSDFSKAFPNIESFHVEVREDGEGVSSGSP
jgi:hypothetical protein